MLDLLSGLGKPVSVRDLARRLELDAAGRRELKTLLRRLLGEGALVKLRGARVGLPSRMNLVAGRLSCSPAGFGFVVSDSPRTDKATVFVAAAGMSEALHGDRVVVRIERQASRGPEGRIIRVLERANQRIVGRYEDDGRFGGHLVPFDRRVLHEVFVPRGEEGGARPGEMVTVEVTRPPGASRNPIGRVVEVLGSLAEPGVDLKVIRARHNLRDAFPDDVLAEATRVAQPVSAAEAAARTDFRAWPAFTIDPETARDHDDALAIEHRPAGGWRLAVHIADVAHYVAEGGALDREAYLRGTSVYFPGSVLPMLPHALSSDVCSLIEGQDRLTQSVLIDFAADGRVVRTAFHDGVMRSAAKLSYRQAQAILDGGEDERRAFSTLVPALEAMRELARLLRRRRSERGALDLDLPEPRLRLDESGELVAIEAGERLESMRLVEEFMLAANEAVAARLHGASAGALFRIHEQPDPEKVEELAELVGALGLKLPAETSALRPADFQRILRQIAGRPEEKLVSYLLLRTMKLARYHEENLGHFGLATDSYAHFTSPIRRYPDLVAQRALRALRQARGADGEDALRARLAEMSQHLSERERVASEAERELIEWKKARYMASRVGESYAGYVSGVQPFGLFVELEGIQVQGLVHVSMLGEDYYRFVEKAHRLEGAASGRKFKLGDRVSVRVARVDADRRQVDFALDTAPAPVGGSPRRGRPRPEIGRAPARAGVRRVRPKSRSQRRA